MKTVLLSIVTLIATSALANQPAAPAAPTTPAAPAVTDAKKPSAKVDCHKKENHEKSECKMKH